MKDHNPHDPVNIIGEAYELFLEKTMHDLHVQDGKEPAESSAHPSSKTTNNSYAHWIENKKFLLKNTALEYLGDAGDETTITLRRLNHPQYTSNKHGEYKTKTDNNSPGYSTKTRAAKTAAYITKKKSTFRRLQ